jgi:hypothetical protein
MEYESYGIGHFPKKFPAILGKLPETFPNFIQIALLTGYIMLRSLLVTSVLVFYMLM